MVDGLFVYKGMGFELFGGSKKASAYYASVINKYRKAPVSSWKRGLFPTICYAARAFLMFSKTVSLSSQQTMTTSPVGTVATRAAEAIWYWSSR